MPSSDTPTRKLAAIMFTDIAEFTKLSSIDDSKADSMENELKANFISYPIPKAIIEEREKTPD